MAYVYQTVDLDAGEFTVYADLDTAEVYLGGAVHAGSTWEDLDEEDQGKSLVTSTRTLDRQSWPGDKTDPTQEHAWPRTNTGIDGVTDDVIPQNIIYASIELALAFNQGYDQNQQSTAERIHSMSAGSVSITNYRGIDNPTRFPLIVQELLAPYLGAAAGDFAAKATGVDAETIFPIDLGFSSGGL